jgi:hypothetical protein
VNGFANGWYLGAADEERQFRLSWTPQRWQLVALVASALAVVACLVLALRRRARYRAEGRGVLALGVTDPALPLGSAAVAGGIVAIAGMMLVPPLAGLALGLLAFLAARARRGRVVLAVSALALGAGGALVVLAKRHYDPGRAFDAFARLPAAHWLVMSAIVVLFADLAINGVRAWQRTRPNREPES